MFTILITFLSAISISVIAAGYSIMGLATLFAGAVVPIIAMGSALEVGKLVAASWLYNNWHNKLVNKTLTLLDKTLETYIGMEYVTRGLKERDKQKPERDALTLAINEASDKIAELSTQKGSLQLEQDKIEAEVGPIKYIAELIYGDEAKDHFDEAVRWVIIMLIFVFDPLAVLLLIAANISLRSRKLERQSQREKDEEDRLEQASKEKEKAYKEAANAKTRAKRVRDREKVYKDFFRKLD